MLAVEPPGGHSGPIFHAYRKDTQHKLEPELIARGKDIALDELETPFQSGERRDQDQDRIAELERMVGRQGHDRQRWNSIANRATPSARTNRIIGGKAPSEYLRRLEKNHGVAPERPDQTPHSHLIEPGLNRNDDFDDFFLAGSRRLLDLIVDATCKPIPGRDSEEVAKAFRGAPPRS
jgi:hypothetical protein